MDLANMGCEDLTNDGDWLGRLADITNLSLVDAVAEARARSSDASYRNSERW